MQKREQTNRWFKNITGILVHGRGKRRLVSIIAGKCGVYLLECHMLVDTGKIRMKLTTSNSNDSCLVER